MASEQILLQWQVVQPSLILKERERESDRECGSRWTCATHVNQCSRGSHQTRSTACQPSPSILFATREQFSSVAQKVGQKKKKRPIVKLKHFKIKCRIKQNEFLHTQHSCWILLPRFSRVYIKKKSLHVRFAVCQQLLFNLNVCHPPSIRGGWLCDVQMCYVWRLIPLLKIEHLVWQLL